MKKDKKNIRKNGTKQSKKPLPKKRTAAKKKPAKNSKGTGKKNVKRKNDIKATRKTGKKPVQKTGKISQANISRKQKRKSVKVSSKPKRNIAAKKVSVKTAKRSQTKRVSGKIIYSKRRGNKQIDFKYQGVRAIEKKKVLLEVSQVVEEKINRMVKLKGKPPKGVVVLVSGKKMLNDGGKTKAVKTVVSPLDFVVNTKNTKGFVFGILERMESDFEEWLDMEGEPDTDADNYGTFDPDTIEGFSLKFIY